MSLHKVGRSVNRCNLDRRRKSSRLFPTNPKPCATCLLNDIYEVLANPVACVETSNLPPRRWPGRNPHRALSLAAETVACNALTPNCIIASESGLLRFPSSLKHDGFPFPPVPGHHPNPTSPHAWELFASQDDSSRETNIPFLGQTPGVAGIPGFTPLPC